MSLACLCHRFLKNDMSSSLCLVSYAFLGFRLGSSKDDPSFWFMSNCLIDLFSVFGLDGAGSSDLYGQEIMIVQSGITNSVTHMLMDARFASSGLIENMVNGEHGLIADAEIPAAKAVSQRIVQVC